MEPQQPRGSSIPPETPGPVLAVRGRNTATAGGQAYYENLRKKKRNSDRRLSRWNPVGPVRPLAHRGGLPAGLPVGRVHCLRSIGARGEREIIALSVVHFPRGLEKSSAEMSPRTRRERPRHAREGH